MHSIEIRLHQANEALRDEDSDWYYSECLWKYYELRRELYGQVGIFAASIAKYLRNEFKIETSHGWEPSERIERSIQDLEEIKAERADRMKQRQAERKQQKEEEAQRSE